MLVGWEEVLSLSCTRSHRLRKHPESDAGRNSWEATCFPRTLPWGPNMRSLQATQAGKPRVAYPTIKRWFDPDILRCEPSTPLRIPRTTLYSISHPNTAAVAFLVCVACRSLAVPPGSATLQRFASGRKSSCSSCPLCKVIEGTGTQENQMKSLKHSVLIHIAIVLHCGGKTLSCAKTTFTDVRNDVSKHKTEV